MITTKELYLRSYRNARNGAVIQGNEVVEAAYTSFLNRKKLNGLIGMTHNLLTRRYKTDRELYIANRKRSIERLQLLKR